MDWTEGSGGTAGGGVRGEDGEPGKGFGGGDRRPSIDFPTKAARTIRTLNDRPEGQVSSQLPWCRQHVLPGVRLRTETRVDLTESPYHLYGVGLSA